jgi:hypothetical protein
VEQADFNKALETDAELKQLLEIQQAFIHAVKRKALKAEIKATIQHVHPLKKWWKWITGGGIIMAGIVLTIVLLCKPNAEPLMPIETHSVIECPQFDEQMVEEAKASTVTTEETTAAASDSINTQWDTVASSAPKDERIDFNGLKTWVNPELQTFTINPAKGKTIEGNQGTLIIVPANAFIDGGNQLVTKPVTFQLVEATKLQDIVLYNLGTMSDGKRLETGGMLYMDFTCMGKKVTVSPKRPLYIEVPTKEVKKGMQAFKGEVKEGKVNWKDPKPLKKYLVNVDFKLLDFLPTGFANEVEMILPYKGHKTATSQFVDSLYYSLARTQKMETNFVSYKARVRSTEDKARVLDSIRATASTTKMKEQEQQVTCGIDPLTIKTIKTTPFAKTFIATNEFENRVKDLHTADNGNELVELYIKNLQKNLCYMDSMVASKLPTGSEKDRFNAYAKQGLTNIKDAEIYQDQLSAYYSMKKKQFIEAKEKIRKELNDKNKEVLARSLPPVNAATSNVYAFEWASPGWVNIDAYLHLLDKGSEKVEIAVKSQEGTMEVYQWLNTISSLTPLTVSENKAIALFPARNKPGSELMKNTFCFAINRKAGNYSWFDLRYSPYEMKTVEVILKPISLADIKRKLQAYNVNRDLEARLNEVEKIAAITRRSKEITTDEDVMHRLWKKAFPCGMQKYKVGTLNFNRR